MTAGNTLAAMMDDVGSTEFMGYGGLAAQGRIVALLRNGKPVDEAEEGPCSGILKLRAPLLFLLRDPCALA